MKRLHHIERDKRGKHGQRRQRIRHNALIFGRRVVVDLKHDSNVIDDGLDQNETAEQDALLEAFVGVLFEEERLTAALAAAFAIQRTLLHRLAFVRLHHQLLLDLAPTLARHHHHSYKRDKANADGDVHARQNPRGSLWESSAVMPSVRDTARNDGDHVKVLFDACAVLALLAEEGGITRRRGECRWLQVQRVGDRRDVAKLAELVVFESVRYVRH
mmetsp:Transcript_11081/g.17796  ORF Transcript_11081/g.17796 Transcript_11081/m.17796 type:complete len:216 (-) Transcript_11081:238-885(-)